MPAKIPDKIPEDKIADTHKTVMNKDNEDTTDVIVTLSSEL